MRNVVLLLVLFFNTHLLLGSAGIYEAGIVVGGTTYYETGFSFNGRSFSVTEGNALNLTFAYIKTYKNGGWDVCSGRLNFAVYPTGGSPSFTNVNLPFGSNINGSGDQQWNVSTTINLASGLTPGSYKIAVFYDATIGPGLGCSNPESFYFSNFGANFVADLTINAPLPVHLLSFSVEKTNKDVALNWTTATEINNHYFQVEHQVAGQDWAVLGRIDAKENSSANRDYHFIHYNPSKGLHYYRLLQVDLDGKSTYSPIINIDFHVGASVLFSPNPLQGDLLNIRFLDPEGPHQLRLFNLEGQLLKSWSLEAEVTLSQNLDLSGLPGGMLFLQVDAEIPVRLIRE